MMVERLLSLAIALLLGVHYLQSLDTRTNILRFWMTGRKHRFLQMTTDPMGPLHILLRLLSSRSILVRQVVRETVTLGPLGLLLPRYLPNHPPIMTLAHVPLTQRILSTHTTWMAVTLITCIKLCPIRTHLALSIRLMHLRYPRYRQKSQLMVTTSMWPTLRQLTLHRPLHSHLVCLSVLKYLDYH